jgi:AcrR family transcriptional regulator
MMPKLWTATIETHRHDVREAILDATMALVAEHGPLAVTMSQIADKTGIGRATLYKYFEDVEAILLAWHDRQVAHHLEHLRRLQNQPGDAGARLHAVLEAFALIRHEHHDPDLAALVHRGEHIGQAHQQLITLISELLTEAAAAGVVRGDVPSSELATYCLHAAAAAASLPSRAAVTRLVEVTLTGLRTPSREPNRPRRPRQSRKQ